MSFTPFNAPLLQGLLGDMEAAAHFSVKAELAAALRFEAALARAQARHGVIARAAASRIAEVLDTFEPDLRSLSLATAKDGVFVPELIRQARGAVGGDAAESLHFGATSQDVIDTIFMMRINGLLQLLESRLAQLESEHERLEKAFGANALMARTRMQAATPMKVTHRLSAWMRPLFERRRIVQHHRESQLFVQLGGPVGTLSTMGEQGAKVRAQLAGDLALTDPGYCWHTDRGPIVEIANHLSAITGTLGKIGQDIALMAQQGVDQIAIRSGGASSAMPHKKNPIGAEALVTLARYNAGQIAMVHGAMVHEQERSGSAWALEWMVIPAMAVATGAATARALDLLGAIEHMGDGSA